VPGSGAIIAPQAGILFALRCLAAVEALLITLCLLNCPHQIGLFCLTGFDVVFPGDFPDLFDFHDTVSPLVFFAKECA
jgi:hypothetical protein